MGDERSIGLTLSPQEMEVVVLRALSGQRWYLENSRRIALPDNTIGPQGQIENRSALVEALRYLFPMPSRFGPPIHVSFDGPQVLVRQTRLREIPWALQRETLVDQIRRYPNFEKGDLAVSYRVIEEEGEGKEVESQLECEVLVLATRQELLATLRGVFREAGVKMGPTTSRALAAFGVPLRVQGVPAEGDRMWMAVTMAQAKLVFSLWKGSHFLLFREIPLVKEGQKVPTGELSRATPTGKLRSARAQSSGPLNELSDELITEIKRSLGFHQVSDPTTVPAFLIDFPDDELLCEVIQTREPGLAVLPYRLSNLPSLELAGQNPSVAAVGTAMMAGASPTGIDLSLVEPPGRWGLLAGTPRAALAAALVGLAVLALVVVTAVVESRTQEIRDTDESFLQQIHLVSQNTSSLKKELPGEEARRWLQTNLERNSRELNALVQLLDRDLLEVMPANTWLDDLTLEENNKINIAGRSTDPQAVMDLTHLLKRVSYLNGVRLLVVDRVARSSVYRFRIIAVLAPPRASQG